MNASGGFMFELEYVCIEPCKGDLEVWSYVKEEEVWQYLYGVIRFSIDGSNSNNIIGVFQNSHVPPLKAGREIIDTWIKNL